MFCNKCSWLSRRQWRTFTWALGWSCKMWPILYVTLDSDSGVKRGHCASRIWVMSKWDKCVICTFIQVIDKNIEQQQDKSNGRTVSDSLLEPSLWMDINPSTSLHGHLASQLQITTSHNCPVHVPPSCSQRYHKGPSKHLVEKSRFVMSTLFPWCTNLVTLSPLDKNTMPFSLLCLIHLIPDGNHFMTFYSFITFPVSPWHHFSPILGLQKATKVLRP